MNGLERFMAVVRGETPDYIPIFGFPGAPGMGGGCMRKTYDHLLETGMPDIGGVCDLGHSGRNVEAWQRFWGTTMPLVLDFGLASGAQGFKVARRTEGEYEVIESEDGSITRQLIDNDITYSMPEFIRYPVRDRDSWEFFRRRTEPQQIMSLEDFEHNARRFDDRAEPLRIAACGTYGSVRGLMGPEGASLAMYDDPELIHDIVRTNLERTRRAVFPLIERLRPEIVAMGEDLCYNHGMLLSPAQFEEFFGGYYREVCSVAHEAGAIVAVDTDGNAMEFARVAAGCGVDAIYPFEVKAGNDLFALREQMPEFIMFGWLEKETINGGNEALIEPEIMGKVPALLKKGRYFPNGDHGIQPWATYPSLRKFMTILHEVCNNPEGDFPRV